MYTVSFKTFQQLVAMRQRANQKAQPVTENARERVLRDDQLIERFSKDERKRLATCPSCDALVDEKILDKVSGLCPICHQEQALRR